MPDTVSRVLQVSVQLILTVTLWMSATVNPFQLMNKGNDKEVKCLAQGYAPTK